MVWVSMLIFLAFQVRLPGVICRLGEVGAGCWRMVRPLAGCEMLCCVEKEGPLRGVTCRVVGQVAKMGGVD